MNFVFAIILLSVLLAWLTAKELPMFFGVPVATGSIKRTIFWGIIVVAFVVSLLVPCVGQSAEVLLQPYAGVGVEGAAVVAFSAIIAVLVLAGVDLKPSIGIALLGAFEGYRSITTDGGVDLPLIGGWVVAPMVALVLSAVVYALCRAIINHRQMHLIKLAARLRLWVVIGVILMAVGVGVNQGSLLLMIGRTFVGEGVWNVLLPVAVTVACVVALGGVVRRRTDLVAEKYFDFSTQVVIAVTYASAITLLLFSTSFVEYAGLRPSPQSVPMTIIGALLGVGVVSRRQTIEKGELYRIALGYVLGPVVAVFCTMLLWALMMGGGVSSVYANAAILETFLLLAVVVVFAGYVRRQEKLKLSTRKQLYNQQQQLFENQKALNEMELKAILAENQSLHGTLELKRKENINAALGISEQKEFLEAMAVKVRRAAKASVEEKDRIIAELENDLTQRIGSQGEVDEFYTQAELLHKDFSVKLTEEFPNLTASERRLATLLRLGFSSKYIATLMNISPKSVEISRYRQRQKLGLQRGDNLIKFIKEI